MKQAKIITLSIFMILLTAMGAVAFGPPKDQGPFNTKQLQMMQAILDLTDEQNTAVKEIFAGARKNIQMLAQNNHLKRKDIQVLRTLINKFKEEGQEQLATVLDEEEIQVMCEKLSTENTLAFILLPSAEMQLRLQDILGLATERANEVAAIFEQKKAQHNQVLINLGFDTEQIILFQQELIAQLDDVKQSLEEILSLEQMEIFEKVSSRMRMADRGSFTTFENERLLQ